MPKKMRKFHIFVPKTTHLKSTTLSTMDFTLGTLGNATWLMVKLEKKKVTNLGDVFPSVYIFTSNVYTLLLCQ